MSDEVTDAQKIVLNLAIEANKAGRDNAWISRDDLLNGKLVPKAFQETAGKAIGLKLVFAALTTPKGVFEWTDDEQSFRLSEEALQHIK